MIDQKRATRIVHKLRAYYGSVVPALNYRNTYELTIAVVLSAQTTDRQVNAVTPELFKRYAGFEELSKGKITDVEKIIRSTGFYHAKSKNIIWLANEALKLFNGELPADREQLMKLPGVGRKSANVILSQGFEIPAFAVDTHVGRVSRRIGFTDAADPDKVEEAVTSVIPAKDWTEAHLLFITHGRTLCAARKPLCGKCPITAECAFPDKTS
ncbi:MAG TPA: endonuclease III [Spirochaetota bacterium]